MYNAIRSQLFRLEPELTRRQFYLERIARAQIREVIEIENV